MDTELKNPFVEAKIVGTDVDPDVYHRSSPPSDRGNPDFIMSYSSLKTFMDCPRKWRLGYEREDSDATEWGHAFDGLVIGTRFQQRFAVTPETYPAPAAHEKVKKSIIKEGDPLPWNGNAQICKDWEAEHKGKTIISQKLYHEVYAAWDRIRKANDYFLDFIQSSSHQVMVMATYKDKETGLEIPFKCLIDLVPDPGHKAFGKCLGDLKSARNARPGAWERTVFDFGYYQQAGAYLFAYNACPGDDQRLDFRHLVVENEHPYEYQGHFCEQSFIDLGAAKLVKGLRDYCQCLQADRWPGYESQAQHRLNLDGFLAAEAQAWMVQ